MVIVDNPEGKPDKARMGSMAEYVWKLVFRYDSTEGSSMHYTRESAVSALAGHLVDHGITILNDPTAAARNTGTGPVNAEFTAPDGAVVKYSLRQQRLVPHYLSLAEVAERIGVAPNSMSRYKLPEPDAVIGPVDPDGTIPRGTVRGWLPDTVDKWHANRPGRGARTDLA
jgi:hypothetical protein